MRSCLRIALALMVLLLASCGQGGAVPSYRVGYYAYIGFEPWAYAAESGILQRHARERGIRIELVRQDDVPAGLAALGTGELQGYTATSVEALLGPVSRGVGVEAVVLGSFSHGNDGLLLRDGIGAADLPGRTVRLVQGSVASYLLWRARQILRLDPMRLPEADIAHDQILPLLARDPEAAVVTWNPQLFEARKQQGVTLAFDSSRIPGEIMDLMLVRQDAPDALKQALAAAWFDAVGRLAGTDRGRAQLVESIARRQGIPVRDVEEQILTTRFLHTPGDMLAALRTPAMVAALERNIAFAREFLPPDHGPIGVELPGKRLLGDVQHIGLRLDARHVPGNAGP